MHTGDIQNKTQPVIISSFTWARRWSLQVISVVMSVLSVAIRVWVFRFGGVRSSSSHSVQIKLVMVRVHGLPVRLTLIIFMMAVGRLSTVVAHVRHGRLGQSRGVLGVRMATHRSWEIGQNTRNLLLVRLSGAHCESSPPPRIKKVHWWILSSADCAKQIRDAELLCARSLNARLWRAYSPLKLFQLQKLGCGIALPLWHSFKELS